MTCAGGGKDEGAPPTEVASLSQDEQEAEDERGSNARAPTEAAELDFDGDSWQNNHVGDGVQQLPPENTGLVFLTVPRRQNVAEYRRIEEEAQKVREKHRQLHQAEAQVRMDTAMLGAIVDGISTRLATDEGGSTGVIQMAM